MTHQISFGPIFPVPLQFTALEEEYEVASA